MNEKTKRFVRSKFEEYYRRAEIKIPKDSWMREWGFVLLDQYYPAKLVMRRHKSFANKEDLVNYLIENAPAHAYYSTAVYKYPAAGMANKGWLGSDLIFDLDADHVISEAEFRKYSYEDLLDLVKEETRKLIDFLLNDFGFHEEDIELVFSGSRGYHIHIKTEDVRGLGSRERREIVDYMMATGLDMDRIFVKGKTRTISGSVKKESTVLKPIGSWGKKLHREVIFFFQEIAAEEKYLFSISSNFKTNLENKQISKELRAIFKDNKYPLSGNVKISRVKDNEWRFRSKGKEYTIRGSDNQLNVYQRKALEELKRIAGIDEKRAEKIIRIAKEEKWGERIKTDTSSHDISIILSPDIPVVEKIIAHIRAKVKDTPDEPVTSDIKRLIRLPTSLHGKSSFGVKPLRIETLDDFDPLEDAVVFGDSPVEISVARSSSIKMKGERYKVKEGEIASVPEHVALYFMCRGAAEIK
jgi:DNA primase small subunit